jgi:uncharacterized membrane protein
MQDLGTLLVGNSSFARDINSSGKVVELETQPREIMRLFMTKQTGCRISIH